jgi:hypothetical protein
MLLVSSIDPALQSVSKGCYQCVDSRQHTGVLMKNCLRLAISSPVGPFRKSDGSHMSQVQHFVRIASKVSLCQLNSRKLEIRLGKFKIARIST